MRHLEAIVKEYTDLSQAVKALPLEQRGTSRASINQVLQKGGSDFDIMRGIWQKMCRLEEDRVKLIIEGVSSSDMRELTEAGHVTYGMIKPHANQAKFTEQTDETVAAQVLASIEAPLAVMFEQSLRIPHADASVFYANLKPLADGAIHKRVTEFMCSGAVTGLVLCNPNGNAITDWRTTIGATNPVNAAPGTIRNRFATSVENNVAHGSDSVESVRNELAYFKKVLGDYLPSRMMAG